MKRLMLALLVFGFSATNFAHGGFDFDTCLQQNIFTCIDVQCQADNSLCRQQCQQDAEAYCIRLDNCFI